MDFPDNCTPHRFRELLLVDTDAAEAKRLADVMDDWQRADFEALDQGWQRAAGHGFFGEDPPIKRAWIERPRGHSKTSDLAVMVAWVLCFSNRAVNGVVGAADKEQAQLLRNAVRRLVELNPELELEVQAWKIVHKRKKLNELAIISSDAASSYGQLCDFVIADEVTHWKSDALWNSLFSTVAKRDHAVFINITNAGFQSSWQWDRREVVRQDAEWYFHSLDGPQASWINQKTLAEQRRILPPITYARLWENRWGSKSGDAIDEASLSAAMKLSGPIKEPERGFAYVAGLDLGVKRDASALVIVGKHIGHAEITPAETPARSHDSTLDAMVDLGFIGSNDVESPEDDVEYFEGTGLYRLADVQIWKPPAAGGQVNIAAVEAAIISAHERFGLAEIAADEWQALHVIQRLQRQGVPIRGIALGSNVQTAMASHLVTLFKERLLELYDCPDLIADLQNLQVEQRPSGIKLVPQTKTAEGSAGTRHGDTAIALSYALNAGRRFDGKPAARIERPLLTWPT